MCVEIRVVGIKSEDTASRFPACLWMSTHETWLLMWWFYFDSILAIPYYIGGSFKYSPSQGYLQWIQAMLLCLLVFILFAFCAHELLLHLYKFLDSNFGTQQTHGLLRLPTRWSRLLWLCWKYSVHWYSSILPASPGKSLRAMNPSSYIWNFVLYFRSFNLFNSLKTTGSGPGSCAVPHIIAVNVPQNCEIFGREFQAFIKIAVQLNFEVQVH